MSLTRIARIGRRGYRISKEANKQGTVLKPPPVLKASESSFPVWNPEQSPEDLPHIPRPVSARGRSSFNPLDPPKPRRQPRVGAPAPEQIAAWKESGTLPPLEHWRYLMKGSLTDRFTLHNPDTADALAEAWVPEGSVGKTIIEGAPGSGTLTRALMRLPKERISKIILLEKNDGFLPYLQALAKNDSRVHIVEHLPWGWEGLTQIRQLGLLEDVKPHPWDQGLHPQLTMITHLSQKKLSESFLSGVARYIPEKDWIYAYGRVPLHVLGTRIAYLRATAKGVDSRKHMNSAMLELTAELNEELDEERLEPYIDHFFPVPPKDKSKISEPYTSHIASFNLIPLEDQLIAPKLTEKFEYCMRKIFATRARPLRDCIGHLGPGAGILLKRVNDPSRPESSRVNPDKIVRKMDNKDWVNLVDEFHKWPFAPQNIGHSDGVVPQRRNKGG